MSIWSALVDLERGVPNRLGRKQGRVGKRHDLVFVAMKDQSRHIESLQILGKIRLEKRLDAGRRSG